MGRGAFAEYCFGYCRGVGEGRESTHRHQDQTEHTERGRGKKQERQVVDGGHSETLGKARERVFGSVG